MDNEQYTILLIEDNKDFAKLVEVYLQRYKKGAFRILWRENYNDALAEIESGTAIDVILMDYFLPGKNGLEITKELIQRKVALPIIFLTINKDFDVVLSVMKLGVADYLVKEEITSPVLPKTILNVIEKNRLQQQLLDIEISQHRLKAIRDTLAGLVNELQPPLVEMHQMAHRLQSDVTQEGQQKYVKIVADNIRRIIDKLEKLKSLKRDKTVRYIKDIKMIDLS